MKRISLFILISLVTVVNIGAQHISRRILLLQRVEQLYRKPTKDELKAVAPNAQLLTKYAEFLSQTNTGLIKLVADAGCAESTKVIVVNEKCLKYSMPGAGNSYSFRKNTYRVRRLADLTFLENSFQATGVLQIGIFVNIGDVALEKVTLETRGLKFLADFRPGSDYKEALELDMRLVKGIINDGFIYRRGLYARENTTFVLRSIAYEGRSLRAVGNMVYNEFDFDKRKDVIVAFRIVQKDDDGSVTILWKELDRKDAPKIKIKNKKAS